MRIEKKLLNKYELKGPRYTSYPTINNFNDIDDIDDQRGFEYDIYEKGYGQQGDDTWQDKTGITYHGKGFNWNNSGGPSGDGDSSSGPTEGTDEHDEASANADGTWD